MLNETANDLANVNTVGYKSASITFADSLTQVLPRGAAGADEHQRRHQPPAGRARRTAACDINEMSEGASQTTDNPLDIAIEGPGCLRVGPGDRPLKNRSPPAVPTDFQYTRAGDLTINTAGYLTTRAANTSRAYRPPDSPETGNNHAAWQRRHLHPDPALA